MTITFNSNPITLKGTPLNEGDKMPDFTLVDNALQIVQGKDLPGLKVFIVVPSLDTGVCDLEVKRFNKKATELQNVNLYAVSLDLPFAQARWCGSNGVNAIKTLSDYKDRNFGVATGTFIEELALLTRSVFVVDGTNTVIYAEYVSEVTDHPDYDKIYAKLASLVK